MKSNISITSLRRVPETQLDEENKVFNGCRGGIRTVSDQSKDDCLALRIKLIGFRWFSEVRLWQAPLKANISFHVLERSHDPTYPCSILVFLQRIYCNTPIPEEWETDYGVWTTAESVCWDLGGSREVTSIWVTVSSTRSSDLVSLSNEIEDIEGGKSQAKAPITSHYGPVWWALGSAGHLMTTKSNISGAHKIWCPVHGNGLFGAQHSAHQSQKSPPGLGRKAEFIWLSLKRTNNVACWYKITQSIMVMIMPFIKIGQLSQHLASIGGSSQWGSWQHLVPYIFSTVFY